MMKRYVHVKNRQMEVSNMDGNANGKNQSEHSQPTMSMFAYVAVTGFFGGLLWSFVAYFAYWFHFTTIEPNVLLKPFTVGKWRETWIGFFMTLFAYGIVSILAAFIYYLCFKKVKSMWMGVGYGIALFLVVIFIFNPIFPGIKHWKHISFHTYVTSLCLYSLYGLFVGFSISYQYGEVYGQYYKKLQKQENK